MKAKFVRRFLFTICIMSLVTISYEAAARDRDLEIRIKSPLPDERFIAGEVVHFKAAVSHGHANMSEMVWTSDISGVLGRGPELEIGNLTPGNHRIIASLEGQTEEVNIHGFRDLTEFYRAIPAHAEVERILKTFSFRWIDGQLPDEKWAPYDPPVFNPASYQPSKVAIVARLDVLRHQVFSEPLPFGDGLSIYDHVRKHVNTFNMRLDCGSSSGTGGTINMNRFASEWWNTYRESCKIPSPPNQPPASYLFYIVVHEGRHSEPGEPGHTSCNGQGNMDAELDHGSGHAWAALYAMWVYKYGIYDSMEVKKEARTVAASLLRSRFCSPPHSSNAKVQAILDELLH